jgi:hypothetical protein
MRNLCKALTFGFVLLCLLAPAAAAEERPTLLFSYEVLNFDIHKIDPAKLSYERRVELTEAARQTELPEILGLLQIAPEKISTLLMPGGYKLETNASLQSAMEVDNKMADRFAASLGYVFRQWSVLVTDFAPEGAGNTAYGVVTFDHLVGAADAAAFFRHAASVNPALGEGFTAFDEEMFFLNVTDAQGKPYSGVSDETFLADLSRAAASFKDAKVDVTGSGRADARFVENDWKASPEGNDYAKVLGMDLVSGLEPLRARFDAALAQALK